MKRSQKDVSQGFGAQIKTFYPLIGSPVDYQKNLIRVLSFIQAERPSRAVAVQWLMKEYGATHEYCRHLIQNLHHVGILDLTRNRYSLSASARDYLGKHDPDILASILGRNVLGFVELLELMNEIQPAEFNDMYLRWKQRAEIQVYPGQFRHRLDWLRGLGYVDLVARSYHLTARGLRFVVEEWRKAASSVEKKEAVTHKDLADKVKLIGKFFEFETSSSPSINDILPSYALKLTQGDRQLDCLWVRYVHFAGKVQFPIEIHLGGNLADTIDRLETVSEYVQKAIIITTQEQEKQIIDRLTVKRSRLLDKLVIVGIEDVYKAVEATAILESLTKKIFAG